MMGTRFIMGRRTLLVLLRTMFMSDLCIENIGPCVVYNESGCGLSVDMMA